MKVIRRSAETVLVILLAVFIFAGRSNVNALFLVILLIGILELCIKKYGDKQIIIPICMAFSAYILWIFNDLMAVGKFQMSWNRISFLNFLIYFSFFLLFAGIFKNLKIGLLVPGALLALLGVVNAVIKAIRRTPISAGDLFSVKTAIAVAGNYSMEFDKEFILKIGAGIVLICIAALILYHILFSKKIVQTVSEITMKNRIIFFATSGIFFWLMIFSSVFIKFGGRKVDYFTHETNGFAFNLYMQLKDIVIKEPEKYEDYLKVTDNYVSDFAENREYPNIIVIMNESFADLSVLGEIETEQEVLPILNRLEQNVVKGELYVSVYGGNTANSEYEFLTGNSMSYFSERVVPFQLYMNEKRPTLFSQMESLGFDTVFMHPYKAYSWNRPSVYSAMGVNKLMFEEDMPELVNIRGYASDASQYEYVKKILEEQNRDQPLFLFDVTVQNHGGYTQTAEELSSISILESENQYKETENYLALVHESDKALGGFLHYLEEFKEPTLVLFFGDHQPALENEFIEQAVGVAKSDFTLEERQKMYTTPFFLWANYDMESENIGKVSANYLSTFLCEKATLPMTGYQKFLRDLKTEIPVINTVGIIDKNEIYYGINEEPDIFMEQIRQYNAITYNYMFDKSKRADSFYSLQK